MGDARAMITVFIAHPQRYEKVVREIPAPQTLQDLDILRANFELENGQEFTVSHPRFPDKFSLLERPEQAYDGCSIEITTPQKKIFVSVSDNSSYRVPIVWYPGTSRDDIESAISQATGVSRPLNICTDDGTDGFTRLVLASTIPNGTHVIVQAVDEKQPVPRAFPTPNTVPRAAGPQASLQRDPSGIQVPSAKNGTVDGARQPYHLRDTATPTPKRSSSTRRTSERGRSLRNSGSYAPPISGGSRCTTPGSSPKRMSAVRRSASTPHIRDASASASPERRRSASRSSLGSAAPRVVPDRYCIRMLQGHSGFVLCICIVGDVLFTGSQDNTIMIWDLNNLQYIGTLPGHRGFVKCLAASYSRKLLFSGSQDKTIKAWSLETFSVQKTLAGHRSDVHSLCILEARNSLVSGSEDKSLRVWDLTTFAPLAVIDAAHSGGIFALECLPSNYVLSGSRDRSIVLWNEKWQVAKALSPPHYDGVTALAVSAKRQKFYSASRDKSVKVWDGLSLSNCMVQLHAHGDWVTCMTLSPDEDEIITGSRDCLVKVWDAETLRCKHQLGGHSGAVSAVVAMNGLLFSASHDRVVRVWQLPTTKD